ncbi:hypothetical protein LZ30DRAFT_310713 [Colletotrichum cereale]|nr:hypothetical protein LZ30DRAFT_310713 [Colletotrichum cereale]
MDGCSAPGTEPCCCRHLNVKGIHQDTSANEGAGSDVYTDEVRVLVVFKGGHLSFGEACDKRERERTIRQNQTTDSSGSLPVSSGFSPPCLCQLCQTDSLSPYLVHPLLWTRTGTPHTAHTHTNSRYRSHPGPSLAVCPSDLPKPPTTVLPTGISTR